MGNKNSCKLTDRQSILMGKNLVINNKSNVKYNNSGTIEHQDYLSIENDKCDNIKNLNKEHYIYIDDELCELYILYSKNVWHIKKFKEYFDDITNLLNDISTDIKQKQSILINRYKQNLKKNNGRFPTLKERKNEEKRINKLSNIELNMVQTMLDYNNIVRLDINRIYNFLVTDKYYVKYFEMIVKLINNTLNKEDVYIFVTRLNNYLNSDFIKLIYDIINNSKIVKLNLIRGLSDTNVSHIVNLQNREQWILNNPKLIVDNFINKNFIAINSTIKKYEIKKKLPGINENDFYRCPEGIKKCENNDENCFIKILSYKNNGVQNKCEFNCKKIHSKISEIEESIYAKSKKYNVIELILAFLRILKPIEKQKDYYPELSNNELIEFRNNFIKFYKAKCNKWTTDFKLKFIFYILILLLIGSLFVLVILPINNSSTKILNQIPIILIIFITILVSTIIIALRLYVRKLKLNTYSHININGLPNIVEKKKEFYKKLNELNIISSTLQKFNY